MSDIKYIKTIVNNYVNIYYFYEYWIDLNVKNWLKTNKHG